MEKTDWKDWTNMILGKDTQKETTCLRTLPEMYHYGLSFVENIRRDMVMAESRVEQLDKDINGAEGGEFGLVFDYQMCRKDLKSPPGITAAVASETKKTMEALKESFETLKMSFEDANEALDMEFPAKDKSAQYKWRERYCDKLLMIEGKYAEEVMTGISAIYGLLKHMEGDIVPEAEKRKLEYADHVKTRFGWTKLDAQRLFEDMNSLQNSSYVVRVMLQQAALGDKPHRAIINDTKLVSLKRY